MFSLLPLVIVIVFLTTFFLRYSINLTDDQLNSMIIIKAALL